MKKIVIIQHEPLTPNIEGKFCLNELILAGFELEYWDISQLIYPGLTVSNVINNTYSRIIISFEDFKKSWFSLPDDCIAVVECFFIFETARIWKILRERKIPLIKIERYANTDLSKTILQKLIEHTSPTKIVQYLKNLYFRNYMKKFGITAGNRYDYFLSSGENSKCDCQINHPDYDNYILHKDDVPLIREKYICFVDTGFGIHPDQKYYYKNFKEDNKLWQAKLTSFFSEVEKKYGFPVVIAVHPKIDYSEDAFGGRRKIKYQTLNLVLNAEFVLQDISNSLAFSLIANKKVGLIATKEFLKIYKNSLTKISKKIGIPVFNIDKQRYEEFKPNNVDNILRMTYINAYLCTENTKDKITADILINFFQSL